MPAQNNRVRLLFIVGLTAVVVGYLTVWLPGPSAGLRLIGLEVGEWIKFLGVGMQRNLFYLPPIFAGLIIALVTAGWDNRSWRTWLMRGLAVAVALIALPAIASITGEPQSEWLLRVALIGLVGLVAFLAALVPRTEQWPAWAAWSVLLASFAGLVLPTWGYLTVRPIVIEILREPIGIGLGVWLNGVGFGLLAVGSWLALRRPRVQSR